jgi:hypothetical protein
MENQTSDLATAFRRLSESLQQLAENLKDLSTRLGDPIYRRFDMPFGPSEEARRIWIRYGQYTTRN